MVFAQHWYYWQAGQDIETSAVCVAVLLSERANIYLAFCCLLQLYIFNWAAAPG
jgi:hypothetical protein